MTVETHTFQADISELMNLIIHAFYSNRDVFLREVISNASDALDKKRHFDLTNNKLDEVYRIRVSVVDDKKKLVIEDTGIGMSKTEVIQNLSTIARSGTKEFVKALGQKSDQIGQFGVGFYSVFLVADSVDVYTQKQGDNVLKWSSNAQESYTLEETDAFSFEYGHGTRLELYLKEDATEYSEEATLRRIIQTHSSFIPYPIELWVSKEIDDPDQEEKTETVVEEEIVDDDDGQVVEDVGDVDQEEKKEEAKEKKKKTVYEWEVLNKDKPIWYKSSSDVTEEEYSNLYKTLSKDYDGPLFYRHFQTEGAFEFRGIVYIPKRAPFDGFGDHQRQKRKIRLYVKNVLVLNELDKDMIPDWMNFVVGVIDSADLPLNVSREMLQQTKVLRALKTQLKKQILTMLSTLLDEKPDVYKDFYKEFQKNIKLGIHDGEDSLLRFLRISTTTPDKDVTLDEWVENFREEQKHIYYATGEDAGRSVLTQLYETKGYPVLLFKEPIDEFMLQRVTKYKDYELVNIAKEHEVPWSTSVTETHENYDAFCTWVTEQLQDTTLEKTRVSTILAQATDGPSCVLSSKHGWTGSMEKIMKSQPLGDAKTMLWMKGKKIFELNTHHPLIKQCFQTYTTDKDQVRQKISLLYQASLLAAGFPLENTSQFLDTIASSLVVDDANTTTFSSVEETDESPIEEPSAVATEE